VSRTAWLLVIVYLAAAAALTWEVWRSSYRGNLDRLAETGEIRVEQAAERLANQLDRYRVLVNVLARDRVVAAALAAGEDMGAIGSYLRDRALTYGAGRIELIDRAGTVIASSDLNAGHVSRRGDPLLRAALNGRLGLAHVLEARTRQVRLSRGVIRGRPPPAGAVLISADIAKLEFEWSFVPETLGFFDDAGVVFASNRPSLLLHQDKQIAGDQRFAPFAEHRRRRIGPHALWDFVGAPDLPSTSLVISREVPIIEMTARGFLDVAPARQAASQRALLVASALALLGLAAVIGALWRRRVADRLAIEEAANARLEARVEERTSELQATQNQLVQASKMTALGQMSAGISHELNQPLAAISNFADNAKRFLELGRQENASENLGHISSQVQRITRIIRNLRAFARSEPETVERVELCAVVNEALALVEPVLSRSGVGVDCQLPEAGVEVMGGPVRLQQVVVNLLTNAVDAMAGQPEGKIVIRLEPAANVVRFSVRDTGPGISEPERVFEPFYSTKDLGASKGLGLGLSISFGIVRGFGGEIVAENHPDGGAVFTVLLLAAGEEMAA